MEASLITKEELERKVKELEAKEQTGDFDKVAELKKVMRKFPKNRKAVFYGGRLAQYAKIQKPTEGLRDFFVPIDSIHVDFDKKSGVISLKSENGILKYLYSDKGFFWNQG